MKIRLFAGGYTEPILQGTGEIVEGRCKGISTYAFDTDTGRLQAVLAPCPTPNPSYIIVSPDGRYLYCANEQKNYHEVDGSTISAFAIEAQSGQLRRLNTQATCGEDACHLTLSPDGRFLLAANYSGGNFCMFPLHADGTPAPAACVISHVGNGLDPHRQSSPHPHQVLPAPDRRHIYVADLGLDRLKCYRADWGRRRLIPEEEGDVVGIPGQGLRHGAFSGDGRFLYVMTELRCELNVYAFDEGAPRLMEVYHCLPDGRDASALGAGVRIHPNGRWLYCSVRGVDQLLTFEIGGNGLLRLLQSISSGGRGPREFALSPDGRYLLAGNQDTDNISVFVIDEDTGVLSPTGYCADAPSVTTIAFAPR